MNIIISDISGVSSLVFPIVPVDTTINANGKSETINAIDGRFNIIENKDLKSINWNSILPVNKSYNFIKRGSLANGWIYVTFLELIKKYKLPVRIIVTTNAKAPVLNMLASIDNFSYNVDKTGDINYSISLTEFPYTLMEFLSRWEKSRNWSNDMAEKIDTTKDNVLGGIKTGWQKMCEKCKQKTNLIKAGLLKGD